MNATEFPQVRVLPRHLADPADSPPAYLRKRRSSRSARRSADRAHGGLRGGRVSARAPVCASDFLAEMQREMRRADRCGSALSLVIYGLADTTPAVLSAERFVTLVCEHKREIDSVGLLDPQTVAVLCPDTDEIGTAGFTRKIAAIEGGLPHRGSVATYPDALFDHLDAAAAPPPSCLPFLEPGAAPARPSGYRLKRALDIVGASIGLVLAAPLMAGVALCIAATSPGPVIFRQTRLGRAGRPFTFYKFRSMRADARDDLHREFVAKLIQGLPVSTEPAANGHAAGLPFKLRADPRVTRIGRLIRRTSIDELPQFVNVLKGDMSLVGPRPPLPYEAAQYEAWHLRRILGITPGITGLWQVHGRSKVSFDEMVRMDLRYQRECSLGLDLRILLRTLLVVLRCDGAA